METAIVLGLLALAVVLFAMERISVDIITLLLLIALVATGILTTAEAFAGFSRNITIILAAIFIISGALQRTGVMDAVGAHLYKVAGESQNRLLFVVLSIVSGISAFMNNTTATAIFVPPVIALAKRTGVSASKLLMPVAFASILGGTCTLLLAQLACAIMGACDGDGPNRDNSKLREIERLWQTVPVYPGMVEVDRSSSSSGGEALVSRHYQSDAPFDEVRSFYVEQLGGRGWQLVDDREVKDRGRIRGERQIEFRRGEFYIDIRYSGARRDELGWTYAIDVEWYDE